MHGRPKHSALTDIEERLDWAMSETQKWYWVADNFNGRDEFKCTEELTFEEFRNTCAEKYDARYWNRDTAKVNQDWIRYTMQMYIDGVNKHRRRLGRYIDERMNHIITREADTTKDSRNPRTYLDFVTTRIPSTRFVVSIYGGTYNQAAERIRNMKLGTKYTTQEWYNQYKTLHRQAYVSEETVKELSLPEHSNRKGYGVPDIQPIKPNKKPSKKPPLLPPSSSGHSEAARYAASIIQFSVYSTEHIRYVTVLMKSVLLFRSSWCENVTAVLWHPVNVLDDINATALELHALKLFQLGFHPVVDNFEIVVVELLMLFEPVHQLSTAFVRCAGLKMKNSGEMLKCLLTNVLMSVSLIGIFPLLIHFLDLPPWRVDTELA